MSDLKVPKLRFPEFSGEWEAKLLGEIGEFKTGLKKAKEDFGFGYPFVRVLDVSRKSTISCDERLDLVNAKEDELKAYSLKAGDTLFIRSYAKDGIGRASIVLHDMPKTVYSLFLIRFRDTKIQLYTLFKKYCFNSHVFRKRLLACSTTSAKTNINQESLSNLQILLPNILEQTKIADFLSLVDEKIQQLTKKKELLEQYKKGIMQQIFNQKIRFKGDNGNDYPDWEEKKLGEMCQITTGKLTANARIPEGKYRFYTCAKEFYFINNYEFDTEALLISGNGYVGYIHYYCGKFNASTRTYVLDKFNEDIHYIKYYLEKYLYLRISTEKRGSTTMLYLVLGTLKDMNIKLPFLKEQMKIADFLDNIDNKIAHVSTQLEKTKLFKKALLQQMII